MAQLLAFVGWWLLPLLLLLSHAAFQASALRTFNPDDEKYLAEADVIEQYEESKNTAWGKLSPALEQEIEDAFGKAAFEDDKYEEMMMVMYDTRDVAFPLLEKVAPPFFGLPFTSKEWESEWPSRIVAARDEKVKQLAIQCLARWLKSKPELKKFEAEAAEESSLGVFLRVAAEVKKIVADSQGEKIESNYRTRVKPGTFKTWLEVVEEWNKLKAKYNDLCTVCVPWRSKACTAQEEEEAQEKDCVHYKEAEEIMTNELQRRKTKASERPSRDYYPDPIDQRTVMASTGSGNAGSSYGPNYYHGGIRRY